MLIPIFFHMVYKENSDCFLFHCFIVIFSSKEKDKISPKYNNAYLCKVCGKNLVWTKLLYTSY